MNKSKKAIEKYCVGCGICKAMGKSDIFINDHGFVSPRDPDYSWLSRVCPMVCNQDFNYADDVWGKQSGVYLGWSSDPEIRKKASSGGVVTSVCLFLLENKFVDCVILTTSNNKVPYKTETKFCYKKEDVLLCCGSRYSASNPLLDLNNIDPKLKYALVGRPCDIVSLRNVQRNYNVLRNIVFTISFFCMGVPSFQAQMELLKRMEICPEDLASLNYRGNGWPGYTTGIDKKGVSHCLDYQTAWGQILGRDLMYACRFCIDGIGEQADISCGDAWFCDNLGNPDFSENDGRNIVFARSSIGKEIISALKADNKIYAEEFKDYKEYLNNIQRSQYNRRRFLMQRLSALRLFRKPIPNYNFKRLRTYSKGTSLKTRLHVFLGTCKRIIERKI